MINFDLDGFIEEEAPDFMTSDHDKVYAEQIRICYDQYHNLGYKELRECQLFAKQSYSGTHYSTARCMIIQALIEHHENAIKPI